MMSDSIEQMLPLVRKLSAARSMEEIMRILRNGAREIIGSDGLTFVLRDGDHCYYADEDAIQPLWKGQRFPLETCVSGWAMIHRKAAIIPDVYSDPRVPADAYRPTFVKSMVMVPIQSSNPVGAIGNYWATPHQATESEVSLIQMLADFAAIAIENVGLYATLGQKVKELQSVNQTKDEFLMTLSHELRTPLCSILGWSELLLKDGQTNLADGKIGLKAIEVNSQSLLKMIDDLLDMSKMVVGRLDLDRKPMDPSEVILDVVDRVRSEASKKSIQLSVDVKEFAKIVLGDEARIRQAIKNVLMNAIQFTPKGGKVDVILDRAQGFFRMMVVDTGIGMEPETIPIIFERFRQKDGSTTRRQGGLGVGLPIARYIVNAHGGQITASSEGKNKGSVFCVYLPILAVSSEKAQIDPRVGSSVLADAPSILVVDDSQDTLVVLKTLLERLGFQVDAVESASEALNRLDQSEPSILLSDLSMPEMDGYTLIQKVRESGSTFPAIALTAFTEKERKDQALQCGFDEVLSKPISASTLMETVQRHLTVAKSV